MSKVVSSKSRFPKTYKKRTYYFFLGIVLFICLLQFLGGSIYNFTRYIVLNKQLDELEELNKKSLETNHNLKNQLQVYSSYKGIEELARNNLKMVGKDEVLVLIKNKPVAPQELKKK
ncbi:MAG TPA: septum formation initiator family protein [Candidatus Gastranaerophilales bacterium]|nr:septum formation initiator family protein [Candidatus Gastranaerophilales bacterium]